MMFFGLGWMRFTRVGGRLSGTVPDVLCCGTTPTYTYLFVFFIGLVRGTLCQAVLKGTRAFALSARGPRHLPTRIYF
jgi:hypothetical protein